MQHRARVFQARLAHFWNLLTVPSLLIQEDSGRRDARLLASLVIPQMTINLLALVALLFSGEAFSPIFWAATFLLLMGALVYTYSRTPHYMIGVRLLIIVIYLSTSAAIVVQHDRTYLALIPNAFAIVVLLVCQFLSLRATTFSAAASLGGILVLMLAYPQDAALLLFGPFTLVGTLSTLIIISAAIRQRDQEQIERQSRDLTENEERYRTLLSMTSEALLIHNHGIVVDANDMLEVLFGYRLDDAIGRSVLDLVARESRRAIANRRRLGKQEEAFEAIGKRKDGTTFPVELVERPLIYRGKAARAVIVRDVTERERTEKQRLELAVERERVSVLQRFISDASHDFLSPITNIKTSLYLLKRLIDRPEKRADYMDVIEHHALRLERLLHDMLLMSRLDQASDDFLLDPISLNDLIGDIAASYQPRLAEKQLTLRLEKESDLPPVWADKSMLAQAIDRLVENAVLYTPERGVIILRTFKQGRSAALDVEDTGMGIDTQDLPYVFDSFYRADKARSAHTGGTGLGLSIARKIVESHDGRVQIDSIPGEGTTVRVQLPAVSEKTQEPSENIPEPQP